jgi:hypothetical protein
LYTVSQSVGASILTSPEGVVIFFDGWRLGFLGSGLVEVVVVVGVAKYELFMGVDALVAALLRLSLGGVDRVLVASSSPSSSNGTVDNCDSDFMSTSVSSVLIGASLVLSLMEA